MKGSLKNNEEITINSEDFQKVLYTAKNCQLVLMPLISQEEIGVEVHNLDQLLRLEGIGEVIVDGVQPQISAKLAVLVPIGT